MELCCYIVPAANFHRQTNADVSATGNEPRGGVMPTDWAIV